GQPDRGTGAHGGAILVGLEADGADAVRGELLVAFLAIAGDGDRADDSARGVANLQTAAFGKNLFVACGDEIAHEDRLLLGAHLSRAWRSGPGRARHRPCRRPSRTGSSSSPLPSSTLSPCTRARPRSPRAAGNRARRRGRGWRR